MKLSLFTSISGLVIASMLTGCDIGFRATEIDPSLRIKTQEKDGNGLRGEQTNDNDKTSPTTQQEGGLQAGPKVDTTKAKTNPDPLIPVSGGPTDQTASKTDSETSATTDSKTNPALDWLEKSNKPGTPAAEQATASTRQEPPPAPPSDSKSDDANSNKSAEKSAEKSVETAKADTKSDSSTEAKSEAKTEATTDAKTDADSDSKLDKNSTEAAKANTTANGTTLLSSAEALKLTRYSNATMAFEIFRDFFYNEEGSKQNVYNSLVEDSQLQLKTETGESGIVQISAKLKTGETIILNGTLENQTAKLKDSTGRYYAHLTCLFRELECREVYGYVAEIKAEKKSFVGFLYYSYSIEKKAYGRPVSNSKDLDNGMARLMDRYLSKEQSLLKFSMQATTAIIAKMKKGNHFYSPTVTSEIFKGYSPDLIYKLRGQISFLRPRLMIGAETTVWPMNGNLNTVVKHAASGLTVESSCVTQACNEILFIYHKDKIQMKDSPKVANNAIMAEVCAVEYDKSRGPIVAELCGSVPAGVILGNNEFEGKLP